MTQIDSKGHVVSKLIRRLTTDDSRPDHINLHGTGTETNDLAESGGVRRSLGDSVPWCSATKGATGHLLGAAGSVELAFSLLSLRDQVMPVTANYQQADPDCNIPLVTHRRNT